MRYCVVSTCLVIALVVLSSPATVRGASIGFGSGDHQFTMEFVPIGNAGNTADTTGSPDPAGSVLYAFNMGKHEVSRDMVTKANSAGGLGITLGPMNFVDNNLGNGPRADMPATDVSWNEAARFVNWLNTSQGFPPAYKFTTQPGDPGYHANADISLWDVADSFVDARGVNRFRHKSAHYFLPSVDEAYKAAFYDPNANGGTGGYWLYPTGSDTAPSPVSGGTAAGTSVYLQSDNQGPADITNAGGLSPYGVMGLGGNVFEWEETDLDLVNDSTSSIRGVRGGGSNSRTFLLAASFRNGLVPTFEDELLGFRVARIPEPNTGLLGALGMSGLLWWRRRIR